MVNRSFCELKRTDVKVCLALVSTSGLNGVLIKDHSPLYCSITTGFCWNTRRTISLANFVA